MYQAVELLPTDRDLHHFVWRNNPQDMAVKQNAFDYAMKYYLAAKGVDTSFYVDELTGADSVQEAIELQRQLQDLFTEGGFFLRKWNSSELRSSQHLATSRALIN